MEAAFWLRCMDVLPAALRLEPAEPAASAASAAVAPASSDRLSELCASLGRLREALVRQSAPPAVLAELHAATVHAQRQQEQHAAELLAMRDVVSQELTDREANAARVVERQQVLADRAQAHEGAAAGAAAATMAAYVNAAAHERAQCAADAVEESLASLECHLHQPSVECARLAALAGTRC